MFSLMRDLAMQKEVGKVILINLKEMGLLRVIAVVAYDYLYLYRRFFAMQQ
jgi:hypothetical protein